MAGAGGRELPVPPGRYGAGLWRPTAGRCRDAEGYRVIGRRE